MTPAARPDATLQLPDGRTIAFDDRGDRDGPTVLFFHGTPDSRLARHPDDSIAHDLGVRVVAADRPGLGASSPDPGANPTSVARDQVALLDALDIPAVTVVAWSAGATPALAFAGGHTARVERVVLLAPVVPADAYGDPHVLDGADDSRRLFADALTDSTPDEVGRELAMWLVPPELDEPTARAMLATSLDRLTHIAGAESALVSALLAAVSQGMLGLERELAAQATPLGPLLDAVRAPVEIHAGDEDRVAPVAMARWLADRLDAQLRIHGAGHEIGLTAWSEAIRPRD